MRMIVGTKRREIGLGPYPEVGLAKARERAAEVKELVRKGIDPIEQRKAARAEPRASSKVEAAFELPVTSRTREVTKAETFLSDLNLADRYNVHRTTVWRWAKSDPTFPQPIVLSPGCTRWRLSDIEAWEQRRAEGR
jgi:prophage regulatory protein